MARYEVHRTDGNAKHLKAYLEAHGASVVALDRPVDWAVGYRGMTALVEVKTARGNLRASQKAFLEGWHGLCAVIRSEEDCDRLLARMRAPRAFQMAGSRLVGDEQGRHD